MLAHLEARVPAADLFIDRNEAIDAYGTPEFPISIRAHFNCPDTASYSCAFCDAAPAADFVTVYDYASGSYDACFTHLPEQLLIDMLALAQAQA